MNASVPIFSVGTRVAGAVVVLGYLLGLAPGAIVSVVGGLALITFGRALALDRTAAATAGASLAVVAGALGVGALRWGTLRLEELAGAQSVLDPTVTVGPVAAAAAAWAALAAAVIATGLWLAQPRPANRAQLAWTIAEAALAILTVTLVFVAPGDAHSAGAATWATAWGGSFPDWAIWAGAFAVGVAVAVGIALIAGRLSSRVRAIGLVGGAAGVTAAAIVIAGAL